MSNHEIYNALLDSFESETNATIAANCAIMFLAYVPDEQTIGELADFLVDNYAKSEPGDDAYEFVTMMLEGKFQELEALVCRYAEHEQLAQIRKDVFGNYPDEVADQLMKAITVSVRFQDPYPTTFTKGV